MTQVKWRDFRDNLADIIERMRSTNERVQITRHGKVIAELAPPSHELRTSFYNRTSEALSSESLMTG
jgi:antitoxin (DNA-binding transcriptional repressor) of toxin-antitoxin stability system